MFVKINQDGMKYCFIIMQMRDSDIPKVWYRSEYAFDNYRDAYEAGNSFVERNVS